MNIQEIEQAIQNAEIALSANPEGRTKELLLIGLQAFNDMLLAERQKKSQEQPTGKTGELPQKPELEEWAQKIESDEPQNLYRQALEKVPQDVKKFVQNDVETRVLGKMENPEPIETPVIEMDFRDIKGNIYTRKLTQTDIISLLKTYFKRVATSSRMEARRYSEAYDSQMGKTVYKLFNGWNTIYNATQEGSAWPPLEDCFPGFGRASQLQKVNAEILWRWAAKQQ
jgi:hypothetical protein